MLGVAEDEVVVYSRVTLFSWNNSSLQQLLLLYPTESFPLSQLSFFNMCLNTESTETEGEGWGLF